jgi:hypothetical protein
MEYKGTYARMGTFATMHEFEGHSLAQRLCMPAIVK